MAKARGVAILVGAGDAIGAAVARRFAKGGYTVCICRRDAARSRGVVDELRDIHAFSVEARQEAEVQKLFADVEKNVGPIEVCLFNAGSNVNKPLLETRKNLAGFGRCFRPLPRFSAPVLSTFSGDLGSDGSRLLDD